MSNDKKSDKERQAEERAAAKERERIAEEMRKQREKDQKAFDKKWKG